MASNSKAIIEIVNIEEVSYGFRNLQEEDIKNFDSSRLEVNISVRFKKNKDSEILSIFPSVTYTYLLEGKETELINVQYKLDYHIVLDDDTFKKTDRVVLPSEIMETIVPIAFDTIRGIMAVKSAGTYLSKYPLPLLNRQMLIENLGKKVKSDPISKTAKKSIKKSSKSL